MRPPPEVCCPSSPGPTYASSSRRRTSPPEDKIATIKEPSPAWYILIPSRVFGPFVLLTDEQYIGPPLPGSLHKEVLGVLSPSEVEMQELHFPPLNLRSSSRDTGQEPLPKTWAISFSCLSKHVRHVGGVLQSLTKFFGSIICFTSASCVEERVGIVRNGCTLGPQSYCSSLRPNLRLAGPGIHRRTGLARGNTDFDVCVRNALPDQGLEGPGSWSRMAHHLGKAKLASDCGGLAVERAKLMNSSIFWAAKF